jgi:predicted nucleotidyltransferase
MYGLKNEIFNNIIKVFQKYNTIEKVYLFGSRARGDFKDISDIDLAIDSKDDITLNILRDLDELRCINTFDVVNINKIGDKLRENIEKDKICIYKK